MLPLEAKVYLEDVVDINSFKSQRSEVAKFMARLYQKDLTTSKGGNISLRIDENLFCVTASSVDKSCLTVDQIAVVDFDGNNKTEHLKLSIETLMHLLILKNNKDINAVVHSHSLYSTTFGLTNVNLDINLTGESYLILKNLKNIGYYKMGTKELAEVVSQSVSTNDILLLQNHGVLAVGNTLLDAFEKIEVLEYCAKMNLITETLKLKKESVIKSLSDDQIRELEFNG